MHALKKQVLRYITVDFSFSKSPASPPVLDSPHLIRKGPTWIQVGWDVLSCNGGYQIKFYEIQYRLQSAYAYNSYSVAARVSNLNYTIKNLIPNSAYDIRIRLLSRNSPRYSYSPPIFVVTFPQGACVYMNNHVHRALLENA